MALKEGKRLILTAFAVAVAGVVTGLLLGGSLLPSRAEGQLYDEQVTTTTTETEVVHIHDGLPQHSHKIITEVTTTETTPHGWFHNFAATLASGTTSGSSASVSNQDPNAVRILSRAYWPPVLTVPVGTTVTWTNDDSEDHTATSNDGLFNFYLAIYKSGSYTFTEPGTYGFYCEPHSEMTGKIIVVE